MLYIISRASMCSWLSTTSGITLQRDVFTICLNRISMIPLLVLLTKPLYSARTTFSVLTQRANRPSWRVVARNCPSSCGRRHLLPAILDGDLIYCQWMERYNSEGNDSGPPLQAWTMAKLLRTGKWEKMDDTGWWLCLCNPFSDKLIKYEIYQFSVAFQVLWQSNIALRQA